MNKRSNYGDALKAEALHERWPSPQISTRLLSPLLLVPLTPRLYSRALNKPTSNAQLSVHVKANIPFIVYNILAFLLASVPRVIPGVELYCPLLCIAEQQPGFRRDV